MELQFYFHEAEKEGWKVRELKRQMKSSLFQRLALSTDKKGILALSNEGHQIVTAQDIRILYVPLMFLSLQDFHRRNAIKKENLKPH